MDRIAYRVGIIPEIRQLDIRLGKIPPIGRTGDQFAEIGDITVRHARRQVGAGKPLGIGGSIGIHGSDRPKQQSKGENWTRGCIALSNEAIAEVHGFVEIGTPVLVLP